LDGDCYWSVREGPIGADSKDNDLPEPTQTTLLQLGAEMEKLGMPVVEKHNLERLKP